MRTLILVCTLAAVSVAAADLKPLDAKLGLWETTTTTEMDGMPAMPAMPQIPKETLDRMPPAQRAQLEAAMKNRASPAAPRTTTSKSCTTKESLNRGFGMPENMKGECKNDVISSSSSNAQMHMQCTATKGGPTSALDVMITRIDSEHIKGNVVSKTDVQGKTVTMKMNFASKWLASDCGDVKPYSSR